MSESFGQLLLRSMSDPELFAPCFQPAESWLPWQTVLKVLFGLPLMEGELPLFRQATGRSKPFAGALSEAWLLVGRRSGKSRILSLIATALACFRDYSPHLAPGERAVVAVLAADRGQAGTIFGYVRALLTQTALLAPLGRVNTTHVVLPR